MRDYPEDKIRLQIEILDWRLTGNNAKKIDDPAAWLVSAIKMPGGHATPKAFIPRAERERQQQARQAKEHHVAEARRRQQAAEARDQVERQAVQDYINKLDPADRAALEAETLAQASPESRQAYENPDMARFRDTLMIGMLREHVAGKLAQERQSAEA